MILTQFLRSARSESIYDGGQHAQQRVQWRNEQGIAWNGADGAQQHGRLAAAARKLEGNDEQECGAAEDVPEPRGASRERRCRFLQHADEGQHEGRCLV